MAQSFSLIALTGGTGNRYWQVVADRQDYAPGDPVYVTVTEVATGAGPPNQANAEVLYFYTDGATPSTIRTVSITPGVTTQTVVFYMTSDGTATGAPRAGSLYLLLNCVNNSGAGGVGNYNVATNGPGTPPTGFTNSPSQGFLRSITTATVTLSNVASGGAKNQPAEYGEQIFGQLTLGTAPFVSDGAGGAAAKMTVALTPTSKSTVIAAVGGQTTYNFTLPGTIDNTFPNTAVTTENSTVSFGNSAIFGAPWTLAQAPLQTPNLGTVASPGYSSGTNAPAVVASSFSGFGNALSFSDTDTVMSMGVEYGPIGTGFGGTSPFSIEAKIVPSTVTNTYVFVNRWAGSGKASTQNYILYINTGKLVASVTNATPASVTITGTTTMVAGTKYDVCLDYDGTTLRMWLSTNGGTANLEASSVVTLESADSVTRLVLGRYDTGFTYGNASFPYQGTIDEFRLSNISRHTTAYTPNTVPFTTDANTAVLSHFETLTAASQYTPATIAVDPRITVVHYMQLDDNVFHNPVISTDLTHNVTSRLTSNMGFMSTRWVTARTATGINGITFTRTLRDAGSLGPELAGDSITTQTQNGQAGWGSAFLTWTSQLPGGSYNYNATITGPSTVTGLQTGSAAVYKLLAINPNVRVICGLDIPSDTGDANHWTPGTPLLMGLVVLNFSNDQSVAVDATPAPSVMVGRFNVAYGRAEYLKADYTWGAVSPGPVYEFPLTQSAGDPNVWIISLTSAQTSGFSYDGLILIGKCFIGGTPYTGPAQLEVTGPRNKHAGAAFGVNVGPLSPRS